MGSKKSKLKAGVTKLDQPRDCGPVYGPRQSEIIEKLHVLGTFWSELLRSYKFYQFVELS